MKLVDIDGVLSSFHFNVFSKTRLFLCYNICIFMK